ncbi:MAG: ATP phosphoribosyltransferase [Clostridia bacterium]|nr:ATP phosphoribosyltransferase [Clostridia bacterium]
MKKTINVALPKGRLGDRVYSLFERAGYACPSILDPGRKLLFENEEAGVRYFSVKPSDVPIYVERGVADVGVAGADILLEYSPDVYELCDLRLGRCRMAVAAKKDFRDDNSRPLRVATKYPAIAREYYRSLGRDIDVIKLNGSIEIAPLLGLSDVIVDIVETGKTLAENGLVPFATVTEISARLIANKVSYEFKNKEIREMASRAEAAAVGGEK